MNKKLKNLLMKQNVLKFGKFTLRSGGKSTYYCDIKKAIGNQKMFEEIIKKILPLIPSFATCIAGSGYGGISLASVLAYKKRLPIVLVRDKIKDHGTKNTIDGYLPTKKDFVCIVDDVFTTGSSINDTKRKLKSTGCRFTKPIVVLNRSRKNSTVSLLNDRDLIS